MIELRPWSGLTHTPANNILTCKTCGREHCNDIPPSTIVWVVLDSFAFNAVFSIKFLSHKNVINNKDLYKHSICKEQHPQK